MIEEHGEDAIGVMRAIKHALDPKNLMNPGKIFHFRRPDEVAHDATHAEPARPPGPQASQGR